MSDPIDGLQFLLDIERIAKEKLHASLDDKYKDRVDVFYRPSGLDNYRILRQNGFKFVVVLGGEFLTNGKRIIADVVYRLNLMFDGSPNPMLDATEAHPASLNAPRLRSSQIDRVEKYRVIRVVASNGLMITKYIHDEPFLGEKLLDSALVELQELSSMIEERNRLRE